MTGLGGEKTRYMNTSAKLAQAYEKVTGDVLLSAGAVTYLGPFTGAYRTQLLEGWRELCNERKIPGTDPFALIPFLGDAVRIQANPHPLLHPHPRPQVCQPARHCSAQPRTLWDGSSVW